MATIEECDQLDSGMGSSSVRSPEVKSLCPDDEEEDDEDETLSERLIALKEMFPEEVRNVSYTAGCCMKKAVKGFYSLSCNVTWLIFSSSAILFAPLLFEIERAQMEEAQRVQQKQVLLGPNSAVSNTGAAGFPSAPPIQR